MPFSVSLVYNISSSLLCTKLVFSDYKPKKCRTWGDCGYQVGVRCVNRHCLYIGRSGWDEEDYQVILRISNKARSSQSLVSDNENGFLRPRKFFPGRFCSAMILCDIGTRCIGGRCRHFWGGNIGDDCRTWGDCGYKVGVRCVNLHCLYIGRSANLNK